MAATAKGSLFVLACSALMYAPVARLVRRSDTATPAAESAARAARQAALTAEQSGKHQAAAMSALADSEAQYRTLAEQVPVIIYAQRPMWSARRPTSVHRCPSRVMTSRNGWLTRNCGNPRVHPDDLPTALAKLEQARRTGTHSLCEYQMQTRAGDWLVIRDEARVVHAAGGQPPPAGNHAGHDRPASSGATAGPGGPAPGPGPMQP